MEEVYAKDVVDLLVVIRDLLCDIRDQGIDVVQKNNRLVDVNITLKKKELEVLEEFSQKSSKIF